MIPLLVPVYVHALPYFFSIFHIFALSIFAFNYLGFLMYHSTETRLPPLPCPYAS